ncbi:MAG: Asp-tRNA(Asn)/Glu-tRNA(Gln) amidotransferase subunit GatB [Gammaproteobacteria bacterium]|nr:MAG: Asp-tRNA(Asn)/Glu-tRNA(Gln) amidotransferase subunit GatB [Gammaproteobacteria bacterium]
MTAPWESVIGLEVHVQLATRSKLFSGASTAFGAPPNSQACPVDLALPGALPVLNREAVRMAVTFGVAIGATINPFSVFDRKNYFYPDLPKGYQISQFERPVVGAGKLEITLQDGTRRTVRITRAHLEEDAGKSLHEKFAGKTGIDLNRAGTPLLEIVSEPDLRSAAEAAAYFKKLHALVRYLRICDGNLSEGSMRCDANVSIRRAGVESLGERTEIKNLNSFRFLERAINVEINRQIGRLEAGEVIFRETLLYDSDRDETRPMRSKELSDDYRYFPEPDLLPLEFDTAFIDAARAALPELPDAKRERYIADLALPEYDANWLTEDPDVAAYFEAVMASFGNARLAANWAKVAANWVMGEVSAAVNRDQISFAAIPLRPAQLAALLARIGDATISGKIAKSLFDQLWRSDDPTLDVAAMIAAQGLEQLSDTGALESLVAAAIDENPAQVEQYRAGKEKVLGFFVGQVMKASAGKADPKQLNALLKSALAKD